MNSELIKISATPESVSRDLLSNILKIEAQIKASRDRIRAINERGAIASIFSSDREDLISISTAQSQINSLMLGMIQEIITLNVMSYSFLAKVIDDFTHSTHKGWIDSEGKFQQLSSTGKSFADTAVNIFNKILDGSRSTQDAIELNADGIAFIREQLTTKDALDDEQSREIRLLREALDAKAAEIQGLQAELVEKHAVDGEQFLQLQQVADGLERLTTQDASLANEIRSVVSILDRGEAAMRHTTEAQAKMVERVQSLESQLTHAAADRTRLRRWTYVALTLGAASLGALAFQLLA